MQVKNTTFVNITLIYSHKPSKPFFWQPPEIRNTFSLKTLINVANIIAMTWD